MVQGWNVHRDRVAPQSRLRRLRWRRLRYLPPSGGSIAERKKGEPAELLTLTLPSLEQLAEASSVVLRVPDRGGLATNPELSRGLLLVKISAGQTASQGVALMTTKSDSILVQASQNQRWLWLLVAVIVAFLVLFALLRAGL